MRPEHSSLLMKTFWRRGTGGCPCFQTLKGAHWGLPKLPLNLSLNFLRGSSFSFPIVSFPLASSPAMCSCSCSNNSLANSSGTPSGAPQCRPHAPPGSSCLSTQPQPRWCLQPLCYNVKMVTMSLDSRKFPALLSSYGTTVVYLVCRWPKCHYVIYDSILFSQDIFTTFSYVHGYKDNQ